MQRKVAACMTINADCRLSKPGAVNDVGVKLLGVHEVR